MAFHLRKLLYDDSEIPSPCKPYCTRLNVPGKCPSSCMEFCNLICKVAFDDSSPHPSITSDSADETHSPLKHHALPLALTIILVILSILFFFMICFTIYKLCIRKYALRRRRLNQDRENVPGPDPDAFLDEDHGPNQGPAVEHHVWYIRTVGLDPSVISEISIVKYKKGDGLVEGTDCSVCLSGFEEDETLRLLPKCNHAFHLPCIDTWLRSHTTCPLCRAGIVKTAVNVPVVVQDSSPVEESLEEISRTNSMEELRRIEDGVNSRNEARIVGRSVSMDAISGSMVNTGLGNDSRRNSDDQVVEVKELDDGVVGKRDGESGINQLLRLVGSLSIDRQACIKRSLSCSANV